MTTETQPELSKEEYDKLMEPIRNKIMKCKMICLDELGKDIMTNPKFLRDSERKKLIKMVEAKMKEDDEKINKEFIDLCSDTLFSNGNDLSKYPVYVDKRSSEQVKKFEEYDKVTDELKTNK
jgi:hypothetical protein